MPVGTCGTGQKGPDMWDVVLLARSSARDPKQWEKFSQGFVLTEDSVSHAAPATVALLSLSSSLSTSSCAEIPSTKHVRVLPLPHFVFPTEQCVFIFEGTHELSHLKLGEWADAGWEGAWDGAGSKVAAKVLRLGALNPNRRH